MVQFTCGTCSETLGDQDMLKHVASTRHRSLIHTNSGETLECEKCQDPNIHTLVIVRFGGQDIAMLCQMCFNKESEKPGTQYTLQNGSILKNVENYFKVRDLSCKLCDNDTHLNVDKNDPKYVVCYKCIREKDLASKRTFVSENDDTFLYVLLGIKEHSKTDSNKKFNRKRQVGRGAKGRKGKKFNKPPKPVKINVPSENKETLRSFHAMSKRDIAKVKPDDERGVTPINVPSPAPSKGKTTKGPEKKNTKSGPSGKKSLQNSRKSSPAPAKPKQTPTAPKLPNVAPKSASGTPKLSKEPSATGNSTVDNIISKLESLEVSRSAPSSKIKPEKKTGSGSSQKKAGGAPSKSLTNSESKPAKDKKSSKGIKKSDVTSKPKFDKSSKDLKKNDKKPTKSKPENGAKAKGINGSSKKGTKTSAPEPSTLPAPTTTTTKKEKPMLKVPKVAPEDEYEELGHIPKYLANQPKLSYDSLNEYFKEMCFHLYLEQYLEAPSITNFSTEFHADNKSLFKLTIPYTEEIESLVSPKMRQLGKLPFTINQTIFVARSNDKDNIWDCFVKDLNLVTRKGKKIELLLELYKWNNAENFPVGSTTLSIVPGSPTISRILFAMARIENPKFIKMLLGKEPIKQLNFRNVLKFTRSTFNDSQKNAIQHVLNNAITVLQGPPGTGKTSTIYEIILQLLRNLRTFPILVVAQSNIAIDNIAEKLKNDKDLTILRIVSTEKEREYNEKHHLADICLHHKVEALLPQKFKDTRLDLKYNRAPVSKNAYKNMLTSSNSITEKLIAQAHVIFTTTVVAGGYQLKGIKKLPVVIMDESTQSSEASTLIPLSMPGVDRFIFVGDDKQLSSFSEVPYLEQSMFERVLKNGTYQSPHMLNVQYRMHPKISEFPIKEFYGGLLTDGVTEEQRAVDGVEPLVFVDTKGKYPEEKVSNWARNRGSGYTYTNKGEASVILKALKQLIFVKNVERKEIAIITPYSAQRDLVASVIQKDELINPNNEAIEEEVDEDSLTNKKPTTIKTVVGIMVSSIDAFQGRERDFILFSCVRSNKENNIGFVRDRRRLNVALTRARCGLILVGDKVCMCKGDSLWGKLVDHLDERKYIVSEDEYFKELK
ncbi:CYFA0S20e01442g1_1 [Cyberlindnera fabianii]|uniref:CYFA0S20e01442g1_1 n=1 Tax=Cyberlindnera fabianii TaxID=36022 RepID=A0A061BDE1_CYBFA|nr:CYFA0S20e01442g1_1 [Cyberlindnera fabianii]